jgi:vacuolar-type H+-ATPase subunit H
MNGMAEEAVGGSAGGRAPTAHILDSIKEAEAKVLSMVREAEAQKVKTISDAKREAMTIRETAMNASDAFIGEAVRDSDSKIEQERDRIFAEAEVMAKKVRSQANSKIGQAKEFLLKDFMRVVDDQA